MRRLPGQGGGGWHREVVDPEPAGNKDNAESEKEKHDTHLQKPEIGYDEMVLIE